MYVSEGENAGLNNAMRCDVMRAMDDDGLTGLTMLAMVVDVTKKIAVRDGQ